MPEKIQCPKCKYIKTEADRHVIKGICPSCGIAYAKWKESALQSDSTNTTEKLSDPETPSTLKEIFLELFTFSPDDIDPVNFWGRFSIFCLFVLWGCSFIISGVNWEEIGGSFLHSVNLPFHEFGHVLFRPFGYFMMILGGSLFQIIMPLIAMLCFSIQMRDNFAAAIMLWWCGQNFIDVSPYIADAEYRALPLIRGLGEEYHDWGNLLTMLNCVDKAQSYANCSYYIGSLIILFSFYWAGYILWDQKKTLDRNSY